MRKILIGAWVFCCAAALFPYTIEVFGALPVVISDVSDVSFTYLSGGVGAGFTTLDGERTFGVTVTAIAYMPFSAEFTAKDGELPRSALAAAPVGMHLSLGCSVLPVDAITGAVSFPVTVSLHGKADFLQGEAHVDTGVAAAGGIKITGGRFSGFARMEIFFDIYRLVFPQGGGFSTAGPNVFGLTPHIGAGFTL
ncbi:MAG: hypothetical protein LBR23_08785 [Spirochaetaceae bacterium]|jgi:hypothetical protein|nr:hypothetical protein [Spirochaetaceae bacterium]